MHARSTAVAVLATGLVLAALPWPALAGTVPPEPGMTTPAALTAYQPPTPTPTPPRVYSAPAPTQPRYTPVQPRYTPAQPRTYQHLAPAYPRHNQPTPTTMRPRPTPTYHYPSPARPKPIAPPVHPVPTTTRTLPTTTRTLPTTIRPAPTTTRTTTPQAQSASVPRLIGFRLAIAEGRLAQAGLQLGTISYITADQVSVGSVLASNPDENTLVPPGTAVNLVVGSR